VKVRCAGGCARPLDWAVESQEHADNLLAKHNREYHPTATAGPTTLDLTAAAQAVLRADRGSERGGALMVWQALTGMSDADALPYAHAVVGTPVRTVAVIPPF
jgi:hypothetical protein